MSGNSFPPAWPAFGPVRVFPKSIHRKFDRLRRTVGHTLRVSTAPTRCTAVSGAGRLGMSRASGALARTTTTGGTPMPGAVTTWRRSATPQHSQRACWSVTRCGRRQTQGPEACPTSVYVREDVLMRRVTAAVQAVFDDADGVLAEALTVARETLELNRSESNRLRTEVADLDKRLTGLSRLLVDPDIEPMAKRSVARQMAEAEAERETFQLAMEAVAARAMTDADDLAADVRQALSEVRANIAGMATPALLNRFVEEVVGPMLVRKDGTVVQKESVSENKAAPTTKVMGAASIAGGGFEPPTSGL